jgi:excisionase family DNA binding protein
MATEIHERRWLSVKEVAFELRLRPKAVYLAVARGELPAVRLHEHGAIRIPRSALDPNAQKEVA